MRSNKICALVPSPERQPHRRLSTIVLIAQIMTKCSRNDLLRAMRHGSLVMVLRHRSNYHGEPANFNVNTLFVKKLVILKIHTARLH